MSYRRLINLAFREGCGLSMREVLVSPEYQELLAADLSIYRRMPLDNGDGALIRYGPHALSLLAQEAYQGKSAREVTHPAQLMLHSRKTLRERALVRYLGKKLVKAAQDCLSH